VVELFVFCAKTKPPKQNTSATTKAINNFFMILNSLQEKVGKTVCFYAKSAIESMTIYWYLGPPKQVLRPTRCRHGLDNKGGPFPVGCAQSPPRPREAGIMPALVVSVHYPVVLIKGTAISATVSGCREKFRSALIVGTFGP
jgi:hypothetical protein